MRETLSEAGGLSCSEAVSLLEEKIAEEELSAQEQQSLDEHLASCRKCRELVRWLSVLPGLVDEPSDVEVRAAYHAAMEQRTCLRQKERRGRMAMAIVAAAAVAAVVMLDGGLLKSFFSKQDDVVVTTQTPECSAARPTEPVPGIVMTYCDGREPGVLIENNGECRVSLRDGVVAMLVDPNRPSKRKVIVKTPHGEVRVKGTMFTVQVDDDNTWVEVFRGVVEFVSNTSSNNVFRVAAGHGLDFNHRTVFALTSPKNASLRKVLEAKSEQEYTADRTPSPDEALYESNSEATSDISKSLHVYGSIGLRNEHDSIESRRSVAENSRLGKTEPLKSAVPTIDDLIQEAQSCLIAHDWRCASSRYQDILKHYPGRPESIAVLISLAKIELRHLSMPTKALDHYRTYQKRAPNGPMAEEALFGIAETYRRLGKKKMEEETLRRFIERYPKSWQIKRAHARLQQLVSD